MLLISQRSTRFWEYISIYAYCNSYSFFDIGLQDLAMALLFVLGYAGIIFEESLAFNKSGVGLLMAVSLWVIRSLGVNAHILLFLLLS